MSLLEKYKIRNQILLIVIKATSELDESYLIISYSYKASLLISFVYFLFFFVANISKSSKETVDGLSDINLMALMKFEPQK